MSVRCRSGLGVSGGGAFTGGASIGSGGCDCVDRSSIPAEVPACVDTLHTGSQLLGDGGFENWFGQHGRTEFAERGVPSFGQVGWRSDNTLAADWEYGGDISPVWWHGKPGLNNAGQDAYWALSDQNPDTGTYHARVTMKSSNATLSPNVQMHCVEAVDDPVLIKEHVWVTEPGLTATFSVRAMTPSLANGQPILRLFVTGYEADMNPNTSIFIGGFPPQINLNTAYATYDRIVAVPSGIKFLQLAIQAGVIQIPAPTGDLIIDVDNVVFGQE